QAPPTLSPVAMGPVSTRTPARMSQLLEMLPPIAWPEINNPDEMIGYIRSRYNPILDAEGVTGIVVLALLVDERGRVARVSLSESSGSPCLDDIAVATFEQVVSFSPARDGPRALAVQFNLSVPFLMAW